jgi:glucose dehydrogenase
MRPMLGLIPAGANDSVIKGGQDPDQWAVYGKDYANTRFSPLNINLRPGGGSL